MADRIFRASGLTRSCPLMFSMRHFGAGMWISEAMSRVFPDLQGKRWHGNQHLVSDLSENFTVRTKIWFSPWTFFLMCFKKPNGPFKLVYRLVQGFPLKITLFWRSLPLHKSIHWTQRTSMCHFPSYPIINFLCNHRQWLKWDFYIETILLTKLHTSPMSPVFLLPGCFVLAFL